MQASDRAATASASPISVWPSQMRTSTVPKRWCGRTLHQIWVLSTMERVRWRRSTKAAYSSQLVKASGIPQRGKLLVKIWVRVECRRVRRPMKSALFADSASSSGSTLRIAVDTATARSAPRTPAWRWTDQVLLVHAT